MNQENSDSKICPICGRPTHKKSKYCIFHVSAEEKTEIDFKKALKEYVNKIKKEDCDYDFKEFIFVGDINFKEDLNITIFKNADFGETTFEGCADFKNATFKGYIGFRETTFEGGAYFWNTTFEGGAYFSEATFKRNAGFGNAIFKRNAGFGNAIFKGKAGFWDATFKGYADFRETTFERYAYFWNTTFKGKAGFWDATFKRNAGFGGAIFKGNAGFGNATFEGYAGFWNVTFEGYAGFSEVTFERYTDFRGVTFEGNAGFRLKYLVKIIDFSEIRTFSGKKLFIKIINRRGKINFSRAYLENIYLDIELVEGVLISFTNSMLKNTRIERGQIENHILQEEKEEFVRAREIYLLLKNNFHSIGRYDDASWAFEKEKEMERKSLSFRYYKKALKEESKIEKHPILKWIKKGNLKKWIISGFLNIVYGYGERPWNVVRAAIILIFVFALLFSIIGIGNPEIIELKVTAIHQNSGNIVNLAFKGLIKNSVIRNFPDSLYFSLITFTTLGYGDFRPLEGLGRILAGSEAFIGAFMMALFVYTFARRTGGR
jgi:hypothetical protein